MLIMRCAWHARHFGYTSYTGLTRDFRWRVAFSDGICRPCKDVMLATARGAAPKSVSIKRELTRAAMALTGVAAWLLVMLLFSGCGPSTAEVASECSRTERQIIGIGAVLFKADVCVGPSRQTQPCAATLSSTNTAEGCPAR